MASWEDRYLKLAAPLQDFLEEAKKAQPGAVDDIEQYMGDWAFDNMQDTMKNMDEGSYSDGDE